MVKFENIQLSAFVFNSDFVFNFHRNISFFEKLNKAMNDETPSSPARKKLRQMSIMDSLSKPGMMLYHGILANTVNLY